MTPWPDQAAIGSVWSKATGMANIFRQLRTQAPADRIHRALTIRDELAVWWTPDVVTVPVERSVADFGFDARRTLMRMRVETLRPAELVTWYCIGGIEEGLGTQICFSTRSDGRLTLLSICHVGCRGTDGVFGSAAFLGERLDESAQPGRRNANR